LIDRRRRIERRPEVSGFVEEAPEPVNGNPPQVELSDEARRAAAALNQLSTEQQRVLRLSIYRGLSHERIASVTGLPLGTVKTHARRGLMRIRDLLQAESAHEDSSASKVGLLGKKRGLDASG
jgi:RNA polymerase sigma-70 factor (ECF subfamily)